jgi:PemK-like, MazF-like toxin of type II toxin-antitoxin system
MRRSEIWLVRLDPTVGTEISKTRPAVIVNDNAIGVLPLKVIVPITDWKECFVVRNSFAGSMRFLWVMMGDRSVMFGCVGG